MGPRRALLPLLLLRWQALSQVTVPLQLPANATDAVSYVLGIEGRSYTIHLQQHASEFDVCQKRWRRLCDCRLQDLEQVRKPSVFLADDFRIYTSKKKGFLRSDSTHLQGDRHYRGYIDGFPSSAVTLTICLGLRGLLQFANVSYGIEPLGYSPAFEHFVYRMSSQKVTGTILADSHPERGLGRLAAKETSGKAHRDYAPLSAEARSPKYLILYVVLDKALYDYMGSDTNAATQKIIQVFNLVNSMFNPLNVTIVLSSLELWTQEDKISTAGGAADLLRRFLEWKRLSLTQRSYDVAHLLVYRDQAAFVGATAPGKACVRNAAGAVAVYQQSVSLESFSVLLAQLLGRSLGIGYDGSRQCHCTSHVCVMSQEALHVSGAKAFSNCSIKDFEGFLKRDRGACLFDRPRLTGAAFQRVAVCGNGVVEPGEQCDCGTVQACLKDKCCSKMCQFKPGVKCASGLCCKKCQFKRSYSLCRPPADEQCDLAEFCNGSSASCPPDLYVQDGHSCEHGTGYCYKGRCQSPDLHCQRLYGRGSRNAPVACYEEVNSQRDRFGHCGLQPRHGYKSCTWRNLRCGKLVCTYPYSTPFASDAAAVIYVQVREHLCVSLDYVSVPARLDPLLVPPGTRCGSKKVCINTTCHPHSVLGYDCDSEVKCHGHGVCNNKGHCHCHPGWKPPDCQQKGFHLGGSMDVGLQRAGGGIFLLPVPDGTSLVRPLLGAGILLLLLAVAVCLRLRRRGRQPPSTEGSPAAEGSDRPDSDPDLERDPDPDPDPERTAGPGTRWGHQ